MTAEQLLRYTHEPYQQELVEGVLHELEPPGALHGFFAARVASLVRRLVDEAAGIVFAGQVGFQLASDPDTVRIPDVAFVARGRVPDTGLPRGHWPGPPDLAIEIVAPNDRRPQVEGKALSWIDAGTPAVVVLDPPQRTATVYRSRRDIRVLADDELLDLGDVVAGCSALVGEIFI